MNSLERHYKLSNSQHHSSELHAFLNIPCDILTVFIFVPLYYDKWFEFIEMKLDYNAQYSERTTLVI